MAKGKNEVLYLEKSILQGFTHVQSSMELGPEDVSLLERCIIYTHFRGCYVNTHID